MKNRVEHSRSQTEVQQFRRIIVVSLIHCTRLYSLLRVGAVIEGVNELDEREVPSLAKEGCREAAGWFDQEINDLTNTTPALRATPPLLSLQFIHTLNNRAQSSSLRHRARS